MRVIRNAEKGVEVDAGDGVHLEVMISWCSFERYGDRDRDVMSCLLAEKGVSNDFDIAHTKTYDLARVLRRFLLSLRTRFFLHLARMTMEVC